MSESPESIPAAAQRSEPPPAVADTAASEALPSEGGLRRTLYVLGGGIILIIGVLAGTLILSSAEKILDQQADDAVKDYAARTSRLERDAEGYAIATPTSRFNRLGRSTTVRSTV